MANKSNKNTHKSTTRGHPPSRKKAKASTPVVESEKSHPKARQRSPPKKLFENKVDSPGNNDNGEGDSSHGDEVYAASVALLGLAQGDGTKSNRAGFTITKNVDENDEMEIVADDVDGGSTQEDHEDEDPEPSSDEDEGYEGVLPLCLEVLYMLTLI
jgi:hypothetical protein